MGYRDRKRETGWTEKGWNCDTDPASSCLAVKTPGGKQERNDKTSSINILSTLLADVYRQFHTATTDSLPFSLFFTWLFISCPPASQPVTCYLSTWSQFSALWLLASEWGSCLKAVLELYSERCFCPLETLKIWDCDSECASTVCACVCVCAERVRGQYMNECIYGTLLSTAAQ